MVLLVIVLCLMIFRMCMIFLVVLLRLRCLRWCLRFDLLNMVLLRVICVSVEV